MKPALRPQSPNFSSGPTAKRPGWSVRTLTDFPAGRSHRSIVGRNKLSELIERTRSLLGIPRDWRIGIVPGSDTGAMEMALWTMLGQRGVDVLAWDAFGQEWVRDIVDQLALPDCRVFRARYGELPDLRQVDCDRDVVFTWNGTTSGVCVPDGDWIAEDRKGLTICDATSAAFAMALPWRKLDVTTWSWQKVLGGEGAHGIIVLSPRAVERLETYQPSWPVPKLFRLTKSGRLMEGIFDGETINTPSMLAVEDQIDGLKWAEGVGGLAELIARSASNLLEVSQWVSTSPWAAFLAQDRRARSCTSICLSVVAPEYMALPPDMQGSVIKRMVSLLEQEGVAYDIASYRDAPPGLRLWAGATVDPADIRALLPWLDWAWGEARRELMSGADHGV